MTTGDIINTINSSLAEEFELSSEKMKPEALFKDDLGLDSLDAVDMVVILEQTFKFKIKKDEEFQRIRTLGDLHEFVIKKHNEIMS